MLSIMRLSIWSISLLSPLVCHARHIPTPLEHNHYAHFTRRQINDTNAKDELGPQLSSSATIIISTDNAWANATERYDTYAPPKIQLVVVPGQESDIATIVGSHVDDLILQLC